LNESIHLSQLKVPAGVTLVELAKEDAAVVAIHSPRAEEPEPTAAAAAGAPAAEGAAAAPAAAAPAGGDAAKKADPAKKAEPAKKEEAKKEPAKKDAKK
jgi:large subunit ribosomal protein L25